MFTIFNKKKQTVVDCFTSDKIAYNVAPVVRSSKTIPDWWKTLKPVPKDIITDREGKLKQNVKNMKDCYGFRELYKRGVVLEHWADMHISVGPGGYKYIVSHGQMAEQHSPDQYNQAFQEFLHMKLMSPWFFKEKTGVKFLMIGAEYAVQYPNIKFLPGVLEFSTNSSTNINLMLARRETPYEFKILAGEPLVHIIPLNDDLDIKYACHLVSEEEFKKLNINGTVFGGHKKLISLIDRNKERSKCPFNFG
jgi:hypothetical protein